MGGLEWPLRSRGGWQTWPAELASEGGRKIMGFLRLDFLRHTGPNGSGGQPRLEMKGSGPRSCDAEPLVWPG